jgi:hypothetical protein
MTVPVQLAMGWVPAHQSVAMGYHPSYVARCLVGWVPAHQSVATGCHPSSDPPERLSVGWVPTHQSKATDFHANVPQRTESAESQP